MKGDGLIRIRAHKVADWIVVLSCVLVHFLIIGFAFCGSVNTNESVGNDDAVIHTNTPITQPYEEETPSPQTTCTTLHQTTISPTNEPERPANTANPDNTYIQYYTDKDAIDMAKVLYRECRGVPSTTERACVAWTVLNRVDERNSTIHAVIRSPGQFAFRTNTPIRDELLELAYDVLERWNREKNGETDVGRVLPREYTFFRGKGGRNYFRDKYNGSYNIWDYSLDSPYKD